MAATSRLNATQYMVISLLFCFSMMSYVDRTILSIAGPQIMRDFGISPTRMGAIYSAFILAYAIWMIPGGYLTDRLGPRLTLAGMGFSSAAFTGLTILAGKSGFGAYTGIVAALFSLRFGLGMATAPLYPACARMTANWIPLIYHARVQGLIIAGSSFGAAVSPLLVTWLMLKFNWRTPFLVAALLTVVLTGAWVWRARDYPPDTTPRQAGDIRRGQPVWLNLFADRNLILLTFAYGTLGYFQYIFFYWMYYYFGEILHLGARSSAVYITLLFLTEGAIMPLGGVVSDRLTRFRGAQFGRKIVPITGLSLGALLAAAGTRTSGPAAVICFALAFGLAACCEGPFWATVTELAGERVGGAGSILNTGAQIGGFFAPILTPLIASKAGWSWGLYTGSLVALSGVVATCFVRIRLPEAVAQAGAGGWPDSASII